MILPAARVAVAAAVVLLLLSLLLDLPAVPYEEDKEKIGSRQPGTFTLIGPKNQGTSIP